MSFNDERLINHNQPRHLFEQYAAVAKGIIKNILIALDDDLNPQ